MRVLDLSLAYRPHCVWSVLMSFVKILSYRSPARLIRAKYRFYFVILRTTLHNWSGMCVLFYCQSKWTLLWLLNRLWLDLLNSNHNATISCPDLNCRMHMKITLYIWTQIHFLWNYPNLFSQSFFWGFEIVGLISKSSHLWIIICIFFRLSVHFSFLFLFPIKVLVTIVWIIAFIIKSTISFWFQPRQASLRDEVEILKRLHHVILLRNI